MNTTPWIVTVAVSLLCNAGLLGYVFRWAVRFEVLEKMFEKSSKDLATLSTGQTDHNARLIKIENVLTSLVNVAEELKVVTSLASKMDAIQVLSERRLAAIEDHFMNLHGKTG